ncbi:hypothetical protein E2C01_083267 [Portunus trituberculatus]|uniref:Uncharacterized protein n=1 Tax=Portunus trituberculatus TaxID=210409 RepID=A0A5B7J316_PORTR|nr:hypothetical protein [Portunus trituberculatus]
MAGRSLRRYESRRRMRQQPSGEIRDVALLRANNRMGRPLVSPAMLHLAEKKVVGGRLDAAATLLLMTACGSPAGQLHKDVPQGKAKAKPVQMIF